MYYIVNHFNHDVDDDEDQGLKELRGIIEELGGWPLLKHHHDVDDDIEWSIEGAIEGIRKHLLNRTDKIFDITSFIIHIQNANNVRNVFIQFPLVYTHLLPKIFFLFYGISIYVYNSRILRLYIVLHNHIRRSEKRIVNTLGKLSPC